MTEACLPCNRRLSFELSFVSAMIMGSNTSKPYVVDEFDSNDDEGDSKSKLVSYNLVKCVPAKTVSPEHVTGLNLSTPRMPERHTHEDEKAEKRTISSSSQNIKRNLSGLMKLLENGDFEEAKKLTQYLVNCPSASGINGPITDHDRQSFPQQLEQQTEAPTATSSSSCSLDTQELSIKEVYSPSSMDSANKLPKCYQAKVQSLSDDDLSMFQRNDEIINDTSDYQTDQSGSKEIVSKPKFQGNFQSMTKVPSETFFQSDLQTKIAKESSFIQSDFQTDMVNEIYSLHFGLARPAERTDETCFIQSTVPEPKSSTLWSVPESELLYNYRKRNIPARRRSFSNNPSLPVKTSESPRCTWQQTAFVSSGSLSSMETETEQQTLDLSILSKTLESDVGDIQRTTTWKGLGKSLSIGRTSFSSGSSQNTQKSEFIGVNDDEETGDASSWNINTPELMERIRRYRQQSGVLDSGSRKDEAQKEEACAFQKEFDLPMRSLWAEVSDHKLLEIREYGHPSERKVLDLKRWYCISRPQYKSSCGISSVVSCWNFLFSTMGHGSQMPVTQETAMKLLGFTSPFDSIRFGSITGNATLLRWFKELNSHFRVQGECCIMYKPLGKNRTPEITDAEALRKLKEGLKDTSTAFIYHCYRHYFCPIGYEVTPQFCVDAYRGIVEENGETWVLIGDTSRKYQPIRCENWENICLDLNCRLPSYLDIRQKWKGIMQEENITNAGDNFHCILAFQKVSENVPASPVLFSSSSSTFSVPSPHPAHEAIPSPEPAQEPIPSPVLTEAPRSQGSKLRHMADTHRPEIGNALNARIEDDEVLSLLYDPIMRFHRGSRNPPLLSRKMSPFPLWNMPTLKEEEEYEMVSENEEHGREDSEQGEMYEESGEDEEEYEDWDEDSGF